jgi:hypothetical protein
MPEKKLKKIPIFGVDIKPDSDKPKPKETKAADAPPEQKKKTPPKTAFIGE